MLTAELSNAPTLAPEIRAALGTLRRRVRQYVWLEGCAAAVAWLGAAFWGTLAIDWFFEPPVGARAAMLLVVGIVLAVVLVRLIGRRAFARISDANAAMLLERRFPRFGDGLLTAVVLSERDDAASPLYTTMLATTCRDAAGQMAEVDIGRVFNPRPLWLKCVAAGLLVLSVAFFAVLFPEATRVWGRRTLSFSDELWPRRVALSIDGFSEGARKVARGADLEILVRADAVDHRAPELIEVRYRTEGAGRRETKTMDRRGVARGSDDGSQEYTYTFRSVLADTRFDILGGDARIEGLWIRAVDSPTIEMTIAWELPAYIGRKQDPRPASGIMQIPAGSRVRVLAHGANKELVGVEINRLVEDRPMPVVTIPTTGLDADRRGFLYSVGPLLTDTTLLFTLHDADGIKNREPVRLALEPLADEPPQMAIRLDGIGAAVTPRARIPVAGRITDDHGLARVWFEYEVDQSKPAGRAVCAFADRPPEFTLGDTAFDAADLGLKPGQRIAVCLKAADLRDLGQGPNVSTSEHWLLDVVSPEQLRAILAARELVLRQRFEAILQETTDLRDVLARLEFDPAAKKPAKSAGREPGDESAADAPVEGPALRLLRVQGTLTSCRKSAQEILGVVEGIDDIRKQLVNNRIDTEELKQRLEGGVAQPLRRVAGTMFSELERRLDALQASLDDVKKAPGLRDRAQTQADDILLAMREVLGRMIELEDFNEAVDLLRSIIKMQDDLRDRTRQRNKDKVRELLEE